MNDPLDKIIEQMILGCLKCYWHYWHYCGDIVDDYYIPRLSSASGDIADRFDTRVSTDCCKIWLWSLPASFISTS
jgi:hypothetical protein